MYANWYNTFSSVRIVNRRRRWAMQATGAYFSREKKRNSWIKPNKIDSLIDWKIISNTKYKSLFQFPPKLEFFLFGQFIYSKLVVVGRRPECGVHGPFPDGLPHSLKWIIWISCSLGNLQLMLLSLMSFEYVFPSEPQSMRWYFGNLHTGHPSTIFVQKMKNLLLILVANRKCLINTFFMCAFSNIGYCDYLVLTL